MRIDLKIDPNLTETEIIIKAPKLTQEVNVLVSRLSESQKDIICGMHDGKAEILDLQKISRIYSTGSKSIAVTPSGQYQLRQRLYELDEKLKKEGFCRISNSEIINLKQVDHFDLHFTGTICVKMNNGDITYVSRRCVPKVKSLLGL